MNVTFQIETDPKHSIVLEIRKMDQKPRTKGLKCSKIIVLWFGLISLEILSLHGWELSHYNVTKNGLCRSVQINRAFSAGLRYGPQLSRELVIGYFLNMAICQSERNGPDFPEKVCIVQKIWERSGQISFLTFAGRITFEIT